MDKRRRKHSNNWNNQKKSDQAQKDLNAKKVFQFNQSQYEDAQGEREKQKAIICVLRYCG
mgnify:CR=1 FL=1